MSQIRWIPLTMHFFIPNWNFPLTNSSDETLALDFPETCCQGWRLKILLYVIDEDLADITYFYVSPFNTYFRKIDEIEIVYDVGQLWYYITPALVELYICYLFYVHPLRNS
jgi:hypothetical protein